VDAEEGVLGAAFFHCIADSPLGAGEKAAGSTGGGSGGGFDSPRGIGDAIVLPLHLQIHVASAGELGWLYRRLRTARQDRGSGTGIVRAAFDSAVEAELQEYQRLLSLLQADMTAFLEAAAVHEADAAVAAPTATPWTLRRLALWSADPLQRLRTLAIIVDACDGRSGGALVSAVWTHCCSSGDPNARALATRLLARACAPLTTLAKEWILAGELRRMPVQAAGADGDVSEVETDRLEYCPDFFIGCDESATLEEGTWWSRRFTLRAAEVPNFMDPAFAEAVLETGRAIQYLRVVCDDGSWILSRVAAALRLLDSMGVSHASVAATGGGGDAGAFGGEHVTQDLRSLLLFQRLGGNGGNIGSSGSGGGLAEMQIMRDVEPLVRAFVRSEELSTLQQLYGADTTGERHLRVLVSVVRPLANARAVSLLFSRFRLGAHLMAMQKYLLLTQGDFAAGFVAGVGAELDQPASSLALSVPLLESHLEAAVRSSNAALEEEDLLNRLTVKILAPGSGDIGWDVFALSYIIQPSSPLAAVLSTAVMTSVSRISYFIWKIKRVEHALTTAWAHQMEAAYPLQSLGNRRLQKSLHACHLLRANMTNFISTLFSYLMLDVLAPAGAALHSALEASRVSAEVIVDWSRSAASAASPATERTPRGALADFGSSGKGTSQVSGDLRSIMDAIDTFTSSVLTGAFLSPVAQSVSDALAALLVDILYYCQQQEILLSAAVEQAEARKAHAAEMARRVAADEWDTAMGMEDEEEMIQQSINELVAAFEPRLQEMSEGYAAKIAHLLSCMDAAADLEGYVWLYVALFLSVIVSFKIHNPSSPSFPQFPADWRNSASSSFGLTSMVTSIPSMREMCV
jgi:hypothetical protein